MLKALLLTLAATSVAHAYSNRVFLIRHGEKPDDDNTPGLSAQGEQRAQCLRGVFGSGSGYDIGLILTQDYDADGSRDRPFETVTPLASDLGLTVDHSCDRDDQDCFADKVSDFANSSGADVLICMEHSALGKVGEALGSKKVDYPDGSFDLIYEIQDEKLADGSPYSENCPGLDN